MQSPEETFFEERITAIIVPLQWRGTIANGKRPAMHYGLFRARKLRTSLVRESHVLLRRGAVDAFGKKRKKGTKRINQERFDQINAAAPQTPPVGCPFCMTQMEDALKSRSLEESMRVRDLSELIAESTEAAAK
jgi:hypothetical protein